MCPRTKPEAVHREVFVDLPADIHAARNLERYVFNC